MKDKEKEIIKALGKMKFGGHSCLECKHKKVKGDNRCGIKGCRIAQDALDLIYHKRAIIAAMSFENANLKILRGEQTAEIKMWIDRLTSTCSETIKTMEKVGANLQEFYDPKIIGIQKRVVEASARASAEVERLKIRNDELNALNKTASIEAIREFVMSFKERISFFIPTASVEEKQGVYKCLDKLEEIKKEMAGDENEKDSSI